MTKSTLILVALFATFFVLKSNAQSSIIITVAGDDTTGYTGDNGPATAAELGRASGIARDRAGNLFIADEYNHVIREVNTSGVITTIAGNHTGGYGGDGGAATAAMLDYPEDVDVDTAGNVYIADAGNNRIRKINTAGIITTIGGIGTGGLTGDGGPATNAEIFHPTGVAVDKYGNVYCTAEISNVIRKIDVSGIIITVAGNGLLGYFGDGGPATAAWLNGPNNIAIDTLGNLFIADWNNNCIRKVNAAGIISTYAGIAGSAGYTGDHGPATAAELNGPLSVAVDSIGNLFIADSRNNCIRMVNTSGIITRVVGDSVAGYSGDGGPATAAELWYPTDLILFGNDNMYIADFYNYVIREVIDTAANAALIVKQVSSAGITVALAPNPNNGHFFVKGALSTATDAGVSIEVTDISGHTINKSSSTALNGNIDAQINLTDLPNGIYLLYIRTENETCISRFVIDR